MRCAPAEIAAHALSDLIVVEGDVIGVQIGAHRTRPASFGLAQHTDRRANLSRRAVAALKCVVRDERPLEGVQGLAICKPLDGDDLGVLVRDGECEAAIHTTTIEQDGTGAALTVVAALLGTGESETFAQRVQECRPGIDEKPMRCPVHAEDVLIYTCYFVSGSLALTTASLCPKA